ncbi:MAG: DUF1289 domain-containing protein [Beijerinckiaceae bacterium]
MTKIATPCQKICAIDPATRLCTGCGRTLDEIANWLNYSATARERIMAALPSRLTAPPTDKPDSFRPN